MNMIGTALRLDNPDPLPVTQLPQNFAYGTLLFPIENLAPVFRECPAYTLLYQFSPKDTGQSKVK